MADDAPSPLLKPLRVVLIVLLAATLIAWLCVGLAACHHRGWV
jgi:hypothetical protein